MNQLLSQSIYFVVCLCIFCAEATIAHHSLSISILFASSMWLIDLYQSLLMIVKSMKNGCKYERENQHEINIGMPESNNNLPSVEHEEDIPMKYYIFSFFLYFTGYWMTTFHISFMDGNRESVIDGGLMCYTSTFNMLLHLLCGMYLNHMEGSGENELTWYNHHEDIERYGSLRAPSSTLVRRKSSSFSWRGYKFPKSVISVSVQGFLLLQSFIVLSASVAVYTLQIQWIDDSCVILLLILTLWTNLRVLYSDPHQHSASSVKHPTSS